MNPFEPHGIDRLSPPSINAFAASPALWVMEHLLKRTTRRASAAMHDAVEEGIVTGLLGRTNEDECVALAESRFRTLATFCTDPNKQKRAAMIPGMVRNGLRELFPYGKPSSTQGRIEHRVAELAVPIIGYYDIRWDGILTDVKTTEKLPSAIKGAHARQVALYKAAISDNLDTRVIYVTPSQVATYRLENAREHINALHRIALIIQRFLALSKDPQELAMFVIPDGGLRSGRRNDVGA